MSLFKRLLQFDPPLYPNAERISASSDLEGEKVEDENRNLIQIQGSPTNVSKSLGQTTSGDEELDELIDTILRPNALKRDVEAPSNYNLGKLENSPQERVTFEEENDKAEADLERLEFLSLKKLDLSSIWKEVKAVQFVSKKLPNRFELSKMMEEFQHQLTWRAARLQGLCSVRDEIYEDLFDEILRQVLLSLPERGVLLKRLRDEINMRLEAYEILLQNTINYGIAKIIVHEMGLKDLERSIQELEEKSASLSNAICNTELETTQATRNAQDSVLDLEKNREEELDFLKYHRDNISNFFQTAKLEQENKKNQE